MHVFIQIDTMLAKYSPLLGGHSVGPRAEAGLRTTVQHGAVQGGGGPGLDHRQDAVCGYRARKIKYHLSSMRHYTRLSTDWS